MSECQEPIAEIDQPIEMNRYARRMLVHRLRLQGLTGGQIAKKTGLAPATVYRDLEAIGEADEEFEAPKPTNYIERAIQTLDSTATIKKSIDHLDAMIELYTSKLLKPDGKIDGAVHKLILECKVERQKWVNMHEQAAGRIIPAPTLIQNNTTTTNQTLIADPNLNPELAAMRARYMDAKRAGETMQQMGQAEQEGAREHEEGIIDVQAVVQERKAPPPHPDVLP